MRITLITEITPSPYNINGPSALPFYLLKSLMTDTNIEIRVYSLNYNGVNEEVQRAYQDEICHQFRLIKYKVNRIGWLLNRVRGRLFRSATSKDCYNRLSVKIENDIINFEPDIVWVYPHHLIGVAEQFSKQGLNIVALGPDCATLHCNRAVNDSYIYRDKTFETYALTMQEKMNMENAWSKIPNSKMLMVGYADQKLFNKLTKSGIARFIPHPHYALSDKKINLDKDKFKVLISGKPDIYTYTDSNALLDVLLKVDNNDIKRHFSFVFHGKGWDNHIQQLSEAGYDVSKAQWVEDYISFITQFDIQLFPISVGTGTKGKVLDALANGLLCVGSKYAFENIAVKDKKSAMIYESVSEIPSLLLWAFENKKTSNDIAEEGRVRVRRFHNPQYVTELMRKCVVDNDYTVLVEEYYTLS